MEYKTFKAGDLFDIKTSKSIDKNKLQLVENGQYEFIGRTAENYGIQGYVNQQPFPANPSNVFSITQIGGRICQFREHQWYASQNIIILTPKYLQLLRCSHYITCSIESMLRKNYGDVGNAYNSYPTLKSLPNDEIQLPVTDSGEPDWQYMEDYMKDIMEEVEYVLDELNTDLVSSEPISVNFGTFRLEQLFDVSVTKGDIKPGKNVEDGDVPFVSANDTNNGIAAYIDKAGDGKAVQFQGNKITIGLFCTAFYQPDSFFAAAHGRLFVLTSKFRLTELVGNFITTIINTQYKDQYNYNNFLTATKIKDLEILLPIDSQGEPDWAYMEQYMQQIMTDIQNEYTTIKEYKNVQ